MMNFDPFGSMQNMIGQFSGFMANPMQFLMQSKLKIPQEYLNDPNRAIQHLMNTGKLSQSQYDWAVKEAQKIQNNPDFKHFLAQMGTKSTD